jgi:hypothetical protein
MDVKIDGFLADHTEILSSDEVYFILYLAWDDEEHGFGTIRISQNNKGIYIDSESMGKDFVKEVLCSLVDQAEIVN